MVDLTRSAITWLIVIAVGSAGFGVLAVLMWRAFRPLWWCIIADFGGPANRKLLGEFCIAALEVMQEGRWLWKENVLEIRPGLTVYVRRNIYIDGDPVEFVVYLQEHSPGPGRQVMQVIRMPEGALSNFIAWRMRELEVYVEGAQKKRDAERLKKQRKMDDPTYNRFVNRLVRKEKSGE